MFSALAAELQPVQLGVGVRMGCEAAVHSVRDHVDTHTETPDMAIIKLDLTNAFNTVHRSVVLREVIRRHWYHRLTHSPRRSNLAPRVSGHVVACNRATLWAWYY